MKNVSTKLFWSCIFAGIIIRFTLMAFGHNFDFESYCIVGEIASSGKNIYACTSRYNYGPIWFTILGLFWKIAAHNILIFRILIVSTLTFCDFVIAILISKISRNFWGGGIFFLNPVSMIITGYHNQFDNIAVLFGICSVLCLKNSAYEDELKINDLCGIVFFSLSMIIKHILFAFPLWILFNTEINTRKKFLYAFIPPLIFLLSFIPYWPKGSYGIIHNVLFYRSTNNFPLFALGILNHLGINVPLQKYICLPVFALLMLVCAYIFRHEDITKIFMIYTISLVCFSSAMANQYLAIPCMALVILFRRNSAMYFLLSLLFLSCNINGLRIPFWLEENYGIKFNIFTLFIRGSIMHSIIVWCLLYYIIYATGKIKQD